MSTSVPDGAQISDDGQFWWDGAQWQAVGDGSGGGYGDGGYGDGGGGGDAGTAQFAFDQQGLLVSDEQGDPVPTANKDTKVSFSVWNMGTADGTATVTVSVDGQQVQTWTSQAIAPQQNAGPDDGYVHNCGAYAAGRHTFSVTVTPGSPGMDSTTNEVDLDDLG